MELPPESLPRRELGGSEIPRPIYELASPLPSPPPIATRNHRAKNSSSSSLNLPPYSATDVSPLVRVYNADSPGAISEISLCEAGTKSPR